MNKNQSQNNNIYNKENRKLVQEEEKDDSLRDKMNKNRVDHLFKSYTINDDLENEKISEAKLKIEKKRKVKINQFREDQ